MLNDFSWRRASVLLRAFRDGYAKKRSVRFAMAARWVAIAFCGLGLVAETGSADSVGNTFRFIMWLAAFGVMTGVDNELSKQQASVQLAVIRGYPRRWIPLVAPVARAAVALRLLLVPVLVFGLVALATSAVLALALGFVSWVSTEVAPKHPKTMYAALVLVPAGLHSAIPELPSVMDMGAWMIDLSLGRLIT